MNTEFASFPVYSYDYNEIENFCLSQRTQLVQENVGLILGVLRGGGIPALMLSQMLGIPVDFLHYSRRDARPELHGTKVLGLIDSCIGEGKKILLVEDIAGVGNTLINCHAYLLSLVKEASSIKVLTLVHHENSRTKTDYSKDCSAIRAILPWERYVTSQRCLNDFTKTGQALADDQRYKKTVAIDDPAAPLSLKQGWAIDHRLVFDGDHELTMNAIRTIGPEEIYCNNEDLISAIFSSLPFAIVYKTIKQARYRISPLD